MAIQYESAGEGYEFRPTKDGKECGLVRKFKLNPALKEREFLNGGFTTD